jgi:hypothetical protein
MILKNLGLAIEKNFEFEIEKIIATEDVESETQNFLCVSMVR